MQVFASRPRQEFVCLGPEARDLSLDNGLVQTA